MITEKIPPQPHNLRLRRFKNDQSYRFLRHREKVHVPSENPLSEKKGYHRSPAQKRSKGEGVFEGLFFEKKEESPHHSPTRKSKEETQKPQLPPQEKPQSAGEFHISKPHPIRFGEIEEKEKGKKDSPTEKLRENLRRKKEREHPKDIEHNG
jgi:hypothetical protein